MIENRLINLNSSNAIKNNGDYNSDVYFNFVGLLKDKPDIELVELSLLYAQIPYSFYNINVYNHHLRVSIDGAPHHTLQFTRGNYNSTQLINEITNQFIAHGYTDITITIDSITGCVTFTKPSGTIELLHRLSTCFKVLGLDPTVDYIGYPSITAPYPLNLLGTLRLRIISNELFINTIDSTTSGNFGTISTIPINSGPYGLIDYNNYSNIKSILNLRDLNGFDIKILDDDNNLVNMNGIDWTLTLNITITKTNKQPTLLNNVLEQIATVNDIPQTDNEPPPETIQPENNIDFSNNDILNNDLDLLIYQDKLNN